MPDKKKKASLGERMRSTILRRTNANRVAAGLRGEADPGAPDARAREIAKNIEAPGLKPSREEAEKKNRAGGRLGSMLRNMKRY